VHWAGPSRLHAPLRLGCKRRQPPQRRNYSPLLQLGGIAGNASIVESRHCSGCVAPESQAGPGTNRLTFRVQWDEPVDSPGAVGRTGDSPGAVATRRVAGSGIAGPASEPARCARDAATSAMAEPISRAAAHNAWEPAAWPGAPLSGSPAPPRGGGLAGPRRATRSRRAGREPRAHGRGRPLSGRHRRRRHCALTQSVVGGRPWVRAPGRRARIPGPRRLTARGRRERAPEVRTDSAAQRAPVTREGCAAGPPGPKPVPPAATGQGPAPCRAGRPGSAQAGRLAGAGRAPRHKHPREIHPLQV
jgi:hypothetical protein